MREYLLLPTGMKFWNGLDRFVIERREPMQSKSPTWLCAVFALLAALTLCFSAGAAAVLAQETGTSLSQTASTQTASSQTASNQTGNRPAQSRIRASGQRAQQVQTGPNGQYTLRTSVTEVVLYATVIDKREHLITNLQKQNFTAYEDHVPQTISSFRQEDVPVSLAILVDNSGSMEPKRAAVNRAAIDLVRASNPQDEAFIVNFSDEAILDQDFTSNIALLEKGLSHIDSKGGTALYDAVVAAADHLAKQAKRAKQMILIITDGEDNSSSTTLAETVRRIQQLQGPIVYSIGLLYDNRDGHESHLARKALETLSDQTGGIAFFPKSLDQVDAIAAEVARDIREQYIIGYHPTRPISQGGYRTVSVIAKAKGQGKLTVRTREGYFASPPQPSRSKITQPK